MFISPCPFQKIDQFDNCTFELTDPLPFPSYNDPEALVRLDGVWTVYFHGCTFQASHQYSPLCPACIGIEGNTSHFYVDPLCISWNQNECNSWQYSNFSNLEYGIKALGSTTSRTLRIDRAVFDGNNTGAYLSGISASQITRCTLYVDKVDTILIKHFAGLYLDACDGYKVQDNLFSCSQPLSSQPTSIGIVVNNSNLGVFTDCENIIYDNAFNSLDIGILPENKNRYNDNGVIYGLTLKCNDFTSCTYDIAVTTPDHQPHDLGIKDPQGKYLTPSHVSDPAGNRFSWPNIQSGPSPVNNYYNDGVIFTYYHHDYVNNYPDKVKPYPYYNLNPYAENGVDYTSKEDCCPDSLNGSGGGGGIGGAECQMVLNKFKSDSIQNLLSLLIDGGNTGQLKSEIDLSTPQETCDIYNDLILKSPYLSDTTMVSAVKKENVLSSEMVTNILSSNPQSAKSDTVLSQVGLRVNQLTEDQMADVMQGLDTVGASRIT